jgi:hypothetical protein
MRASSVLLVAMTALTGALAGCGGDERAADSVPATESGSATTENLPADTTRVTDPTPPADATSDEGGVVALGVAPCDLLTPSDVAAATGLAVGAVDDAAVAPPNFCMFDVGVSADVFVSVDDGQGRSTGPASLFALYADSADAELITNLGTQAVYSSMYRTLTVDVGAGRFFAVGLSGGYPEELVETREILVALATMALEGLN